MNALDYLTLEEKRRISQILLKIGEAQTSVEVELYRQQIGLIMERIIIRRKNEKINGSKPLDYLTLGEKAKISQILLKVGEAKTVVEVELYRQQIGLIMERMVIRMKNEKE